MLRLLRLNRKLLTEKERRVGYNFKFNVNGLLRGSQKERFDSYHLGLQDGWLSRNEVRVMEDLPVVDTLDEYLVPNNMIQPNDGGSSDTVITEEVGTEEAQPDVSPLVRSIAERIASKERRALERCGNDLSAVALLYKNHPEFIERVAMPTAEFMLGGECKDFVRKFATRHIKKQMNQEAKSVGDLVVEENEIITTFFEVLKEHENY